ncbi:MAG: adenylate/guanylate cyclase domain-containing protein [Dehalococcoidia bacterium]
METNAITPAREQDDLLIVFLDLARYSAFARTQTDRDVADLLDQFYGMVSAATEASGGRVIKFTGDGAFLTWPVEEADRAIPALLELRTRVHGWATARGWATELVVKAHAGSAVCGTFGAPAFANYDVIGSAVAIAARLEARTMALSADAFRKLSPETRKMFKKHTPPVVYIPAGDRRP